jgi:hypothetical protein
MAAGEPDGGDEPDVERSTQEGPLIGIVKRLSRCSRPRCPRCLMPWAVGSVRKNNVTQTCLKVPSIVRTIVMTAVIKEGTYSVEEAS